jgi:hypothetical protein
MFRTALVTSLALTVVGWGNALEVNIGSPEFELPFRAQRCDAPAVQQPDGTYAKLSDTGLYCDITKGTIDQHANFYLPEIPLWSDGADKVRYMRIPPGTMIDSSDMDRWIFPVGMKAWKEFSMNGRKVETRFLEKRPDNTWLMVSFQWNAEQTDAFPVPKGVTNANGTRLDIPPVADCVECHSSVADAMNGISALMLARASHRGTTLLDLAWQRKLTHNPSHFIDFPGNETTRLALAYVYANCAHCHRGESAPAGLEFTTSVYDWKPEDTAVYRTAVNHELTSWVDHGYTTRVVPGSPDTSGMVARMSTRTPGDQMPEIATKIVDPQGIAMIREWIEQLPWSAHR